MINLLCAAILLLGLFAACGMAPKENMPNLRNTYWIAVDGIDTEEFRADLFLWDDTVGYFRFSQASEESGWYGFRDVFECRWALDDGVLALTRPEAPGEAIFTGEKITGTYERDRLLIAYDGFFDEELSITMERAELPPYGAQWELPDSYGTWRMVAGGYDASEITLSPSHGGSFWALDGNIITMEHDMRIERKEGPGWENCSNKAWHVQLNGNRGQRFTIALDGNRLLMLKDGEQYQYEWVAFGYDSLLLNYDAWEGEWSRTDGAGSADIAITNAKAGSFDFSFLGMYTNPYGSVHVGDLEGTAHFSGENQALFEYEDEYGGGTILFGFVLHEGKLLVSADENTLFGMNVIIDGVYVKRGPAKAAAPPEELPEKMEISVIREGDEELFTGTLHKRPRLGYAIYLLPDFEISEHGNGYDLVAPITESGVSSDLLMRIYQIDPNHPVPASEEEYGIAPMTDYMRFAVRDKTFEAQLNYPWEAAEGGLILLRAMAKTIRRIP